MEWVVAYDDGRILRQNQDGKEMLFGEIEQDKIVEFSLVTPNFNISVFPRQGKFGLFSLLNTPNLSTNSAFVFDFETLKEDALEYRLVYFVRRKKTLSTGDVEDVKDEDEYFIGLQTTKEGVNYIRLLKYKDGNLSVVDKK